MAYEGAAVMIPGLVASADLSAKQFYLVGLDSSGEVELAGDGARMVGILQNKPNAQGKAATVMMLGVSKYVGGAAGTGGGELASDAAGKGINAIAADYVCGEIIIPAGADAEVGSVALNGVSQKNA